MHKNKSKQVFALIIGGVMAAMLAANARAILQNVDLIMSGGATFEIGEGRDLSASYQGRPQKVKWSVDNTQIATLSYPTFLHYRQPAPGQQHISHVIRVDCKSKGATKVKAEPLNTRIGPNSVTINCVEKGGKLTRNPEPYTFGWEAPISQRAKNDFNLPDPCAIGKSLADIVHADRTGCTIRSDSGKCTQCHQPGRLRANINFVNMSKQNFCTVIQSFISNSANPQNLRNFFQDWVNRGCPDFTTGHFLKSSLKSAYSLLH